jgi:hypothetical protein
MYSRMRVKAIIAILSACTKAGKMCPSHMQGIPQQTLEILRIFEKYATENISGRIVGSHALV